jgi:hypothetical protein
MESQLRAEDLLTAAAPVAAAATTTYAEGRHAGWWDHSPQPLPDASPAPTLPPGPPEESPPFEPAGPGPSMSGGPVAAEPGLEEPPGRPAPHLQALVDEELIDLEAFAHLAQLPDKDDVAALQREQSGADTHGPSRPLRSVRTGYAYRGPPACTVRTPRAAWPQGPGILYTYWVRVPRAMYRGTPGELLRGTGVRAGLCTVRRWQCSLGKHRGVHTPTLALTLTLTLALALILT